jgi:uncharacterized protein (TIGR02145 family)
MKRTKSLILTASVALAMAFIFSCSSDDDGGGPTECPAYDAASQFCDSRDFRIYKYVNIDGQIWMAENLNYNANGAKCYDGKSGNCDKYGKLYNWNAAKTACPSGWHLPTPDEIQALATLAGGEDIAGKKIRTRSGWAGKGNGTDDYGFSSLPAGSDDGQGSYLGMNYYSCWWSSTELNADSAHGFITGNFDGLIDSLTNGIFAGFGDMGNMIKDMLGDMCSSDLSMLAGMGMDSDLDFGSIFGKDFCDLKDGFDDMLLIGPEEKRRLLSVRCLKN